MNCLRMRGHVLIAGVVLLLAVLGAHAQESPQKTQSSAPESSPSEKSGAQEGSNRPPPANPGVALPVHRFWDRENDWLFAGVAAGRALDYASTLNLRRRHIDEALLTNAVVDNHPLFAGIEVAGSAASVGVSYIFHRTGHHRLERWTSIIHIGAATGGAIRNYALKTPHNY